MDYKFVLFEKHDNIATITFNRPDRMNAANWGMNDEIVTALKSAEADKDVRVVVLTGAGRAFHAGLDLKARAEGSESTGFDRRVQGHPVARALLAMEKPTIACMNGVAAGAGFEMALLCDFRIAAEGIKMGDLHVKRNLVPDCAGVWILPRLVGWSKACEIILGGDFIDVAECFRLGVVNKVVPPEKLKDATYEYARKLAANAPVAMQLSKKLMRQALFSQPEDILYQSILLDGYLMQTEDWKESLAAFAEKREAHFEGR